MAKENKWWKYYFKTELIKKVESPINGTIEVLTLLNKPRLMIGGMLQSGGIVRGLWEKALLKIKKEDHQVKKVLILGLGCGDCAFVVEELYPKAYMVGVEIDGKVVDVAKSFFNLSSVKNLEVIIDDGVKYVEKLAKKKIKSDFDVVIIDVYLGKKMPKVFRTKKFYTNLKKLVDKNGVVMINHLFFKEYKDAAQEFVKSLSRWFGTIELQRTATNLVVFGYDK